MNTLWSSIVIQVILLHQNQTQKTKKEVAATENTNKQ